MNRLASSSLQLNTRLDQQIWQTFPTVAGIDRISYEKETIRNRIEKIKFYRLSISMTIKSIQKRLNKERENIKQREMEAFKMDRERAQHQMAIQCQLQS